MAIIWPYATKAIERGLNGRLLKADPRSPKLWRRVISRPLRLFSHHAIGFGLCFGATGNERQHAERDYVLCLDAELKGF